MTGVQTCALPICLDGDSYNFQFRKSGGVEARGKGLSGIDDNKYIYKYGQKMKADSDEKYIAVGVVNSEDVGADFPGVIVQEADLVNIRSNAYSNYINKDDETVKYENNWTGTILGLPADCYLINTSGSIVKNKTAGKDGDDWYFYVKDKQIKLYSNNKTLQPKKDSQGNNVNGNLDLTDWKDDCDSSTNN